MKKKKHSTETSGISPEEIRRLKSLGCLRDKRYQDIFNVRVITRNGFVSREDQAVIKQAADLFGTGDLRLTPQLGIEIQGVKYEDVDALLTFISQHGLMTGGTGLGVHPVLSCKGTACQHGLLDSFALADELNKRFFIPYRGVGLPHKLKIVVSGCPNNCVKASLSDIGIIGQRVPLPENSKCRGCRKCQVEACCPAKAAVVEKGKIYIDPAACRNCGSCIGRCPFGVFDACQDGYQVCIGGRSDRIVAHGRPLTRLFRSREELMAVVEKAILLYRREGAVRERFAQTIDRLGFDYVNDKLLSFDMTKADS